MSTINDPNGTDTQIFFLVSCWIRSSSLISNHSGRTRLSTC